MAGDRRLSPIPHLSPVSRIRDIAPPGNFIGDIFGGGIGDPERGATPATHPEGTPRRGMGRCSRRRRPDALDGDAGQVIRFEMAGFVAVAAFTWPCIPRLSAPRTPRDFLPHKKSSLPPKPTWGGGWSIVFPGFRPFRWILSRKCHAYISRKLQIGVTLASIKPLIHHSSQRCSEHGSNRIPICHTRTTRLCSAPWTAH